MMTKEEYAEEMYEIFIFTDETESEYAICFDGDQIFRACTVEGARYNQTVDNFVITEWPDSYEQWRELLNEWIKMHDEFSDNVGYDKMDTLREQIASIVETVVTQ